MNIYKQCLGTQRNIVETHGSRGFSRASIQDVSMARYLKDGCGMLRHVVAKADDAQATSIRTSTANNNQRQCVCSCMFAVFPTCSLIFYSIIGFNRFQPLLRIKPCGCCCRAVHPRRSCSDGFQFARNSLRKSLVILANPWCSVAAFYGNPPLLVIVEAGNLSHNHLWCVIGL